MKGSMQNWPMTVDKILAHAAQWHGAREVVSRAVEGPVVRTTYAEIFARSKRLSSALIKLGIKKGDRVATMAWNTGRHLEAWYAIMGIGAICHTLNPRLFPEQLKYIINHASDKIILADISFAGLLEELQPSLKSVRRIVFLTDEEQLQNISLPNITCVETLIASHQDLATWGKFAEDTPAALCYTSGTTGNPKGVLYSHRSNFLHTLITLGSDVFGFRSRDVVLPIVPMFHANAWGIALSAPAVGAKLVMPGAQLDGASVYELLESEQVTISAAVPTVWQMLITHMQENDLELSSLRRVVIGGSAAPESMIRILRDAYGVEVNHAWGMTELSPLGTISTPSANVAAMDPDRQLKYALKQGRPPIGVDLKLVDEIGSSLSTTEPAMGRLMVKGPYVVQKYFRGAGGQILDADGYFDTGDMAKIDSEGYMQITDRAKDVIKSGGEWISSIDIENATAGLPGVALCAVIGVAHEKWGERPVLIIQEAKGANLKESSVLDFLNGKIAKWWMPDKVLFVEEIPLGPTGKVDKKLLRLDISGATNI